MAGKRRKKTVELGAQRIGGQAAAARLAGSRFELVEERL
jgi:hypothetical protein